MNKASSIATFLVGCTIALTLQVYFFSPINSPEILLFPPSSPSPNNYLQQVIKLGEGSVLNPEDVCMDKHGDLVTATRDGWIKKLYKNGSLENWKMTGSECLKHWLEGDQKGKTEVFVDNLPGGPDNIHLAPDGSFWIALLQLTPRELEFVHKSKVAKHIIATFPTLIDIVKGTTKKTIVVNVNAQGQITRRFDDPEGKVVSFVTTALEYEDHLYIGGLNINFVGKDT
ncbi:hypothetical protein V2J09_003222 [Rumex salicifolius]